MNKEIFWDYCVKQRVFPSLVLFRGSPKYWVIKINPATTVCGSSPEDAVFRAMAYEEKISNQPKEGPNE